MISSMFSFDITGINVLISMFHAILYIITLLSILHFNGDFIFSYPSQLQSIHNFEIRIFRYLPNYLMLMY